MNPSITIADKAPALSMSSWHNHFCNPDFLEKAFSDIQVLKFTFIHFLNVGVKGQVENECSEIEWQYKVKCFLNDCLRLESLLKKLCIPNK